MYRVKMQRRARRSLERLPKKDHDSVLGAVKDLANNPRPRDVAKIKSAEGMWRVRQGDYRIVYDIDDNQKIITVLDIDHRKQVYRWL